MAPNAEEWLKDYGDFSRCYLCGAHSGANIAFNVALRMLDLHVDLAPLKVSGLVLTQPMFGRVEDQELWNLVLPIGMEEEHCYRDPTSEQMERIRKVGSGWRWLVVDKTHEFDSRLVECGVKVQAGLDHVGLNCKNKDIMEERWDGSVFYIIENFVI